MPGVLENKAELPLGWQRVEFLRAGKWELSSKVADQFPSCCGSLWTAKEPTVVILRAPFSLEAPFTALNLYPDLKCWYLHLY